MAKLKFQKSYLPHIRYFSGLSQRVSTCSCTLQTLQRPQDGKVNRVETQNFMDMLCYVISKETRLF